MRQTFTDKAFHLNNTIKSMTELLLEGLAQDVLGELQEKGFPVRRTSYDADDRSITMVFDNPPGGGPDGTFETWRPLESAVRKFLAIYRDEDEDEGDEWFESDSRADEHEGSLTLHLKVDG